MIRPVGLFAIALVLSGPAVAGQKTGEPADFAAAAGACIAALSSESELANALSSSGWEEAGSNPIGKRYTRDGTPVAIITSTMMGSPSCVVDGYLAKGQKDGLDEVIETGLAATYGEALEVNRSAFGTGFVVGEVMAILSFENRSGGLSTRITAMSMAEEK